jgi:dihydrofolate reductase
LQNQDCEGGAHQFEWQNSHIVGGDVAWKIIEIKAEGDGDIVMSGSATTAHRLLREGLIDELHLLIRPIVIWPGLAAPVPG